MADKYINYGDFKAKFKVPRIPNYILTDNKDIKWKVDELPEELIIHLASEFKSELIKKWRGIK